MFLGLSLGDSIGFPNLFQRWALLLALVFAVFGSVPQMAKSQATCGVTSGTNWKTATWKVDDDGTPGFGTGGDSDCPVSDNGDGRYPDGDDSAVITPDVRLGLDLNLTSSGEGKLSELILQEGSSADASGTALNFAGNNVATTGDVENNSPGSQNGLILTSFNGTGSLTVGGRLVNSGNVRGDNSGVEFLISDQLDNNTDGVLKLAGADSVAVANGIENDGDINLPTVTDTVVVGGATLRNRQDLDVSGSVVEISTGGSLAQTGSSFNTSNSTFVFSGSDQAISGSGSSGDGTSDITFSEIELTDETTVDPGIDVRVEKRLTVNLNNQWGSGSSEDAEVFFFGDSFSVLQDSNAPTNDAEFFSSRIVFRGSGTTTVEGEVFSAVQVETDLSLDGKFSIGDKLNHLTSEIIVGTGDELDLNDDGESNGTLTVDGTLKFSGLGSTTSDNDKEQDFIGTGDFNFNGLDVTGSGTKVRIEPNVSAVDIGNLFIEGSSRLDVAGNLLVSQDLTANGTLEFVGADDGKLVLDGSGSQSVTANTAFPIRVLEIANSGSQNVSLTSGTEVQVEKLLELANGTFDVSSGTLTLKSSGSPHAILNYGGGSISGAVTAERQLTNGPDWYFLTNPEGTTYNSFLRQDNQLARNSNGANLWVQGHSGSDVPNASFSNTNLFVYDETSDSTQDNGWSRSNISGLGSSATRGGGFILYPFTDDDNDGSGDGFPKNISIRAEPTTTTSFPFPVTATDRPNSTTPDTDDVIDAEEGWNLLGNPYLTNIGWTDFSLTNVDEVVYIYEPLGGYSSFNGTTEVNDSDSSFVSDGIIGPFQAFFVKATDGTDPANANYKVEISDITTAQRDSIGNDPFLKSTNSRKERVLALDLSLAGLSEKTKFTFRRDGMMEKDVADAYHLKSPRSSGSLQSANFLSLYSVLENGNALSINNLPYELDNAATIPVQPELRGCDGSDPYVGKVAISLSGTRNIPSGWRLVLEDHKTDEEINLRQRAGYSFTLESSTSGEVCSKSLSSKKASDSQQISPLPSPEVTSRSMAKDGQPDTRFTLHIEPKSSASPPTTPTMPPVEFGRFEGRTEGKAAVLTWTTTRERDNDGFYVQRKTEDGSFSSLEDAFVEGQGTSTASQEYSYRVENLDVGTHTFRLKQVGTEGATTYSDPIEVKVGLSGAFELSTYPNPARTQATVEVAVRERSDVTLSLYNTLGQEIRTVYRGPMPAEQTKRVRIDVQDLSSGVYFLRFEGEGITGTRRMTVVK